MRATASVAAPAPARAGPHELTARVRWLQKGATAAQPQAVQVALAVQAGVGRPGEPLQHQAALRRSEHTLNGSMHCCNISMRRSAPRPPRRVVLTGTCAQSSHRMQRVSAASGSPLAFRTPCS